MEHILHQEELAISFPQTLYFSIEKPLIVTEVIKSLSGLNQLVKNTRPTLNTLLESEISLVELHIKSIEEGSLLEKTFVKLFFNSQEEFDAFLQNIHDKFGDEAMKTTGAIILAVVGGFSLYGMISAATAGKDNGTIAIDSYHTINNYYINAPTWQEGAALTGKTPAEFKQAIESTIKNKKAVAQGAVNLLAPTQNDPAAAVFIGKELQTQTPTLPSSVVAATPHGKIDFSSLEETVEYPNVDIQIRALDLDHPKKGWAGIIPNIIDYRVKIEVAENIDQAKLKINKTISADVEIEFKKDSATGQMKATRIFLTKIL